MNVLITGANGYIGRVLTDAFVGCGWEVYATDHHKEPVVERTTYVQANLTVHYDICKLVDAFKPEKIKALVHCAAFTGTGKLPTNSTSGEDAAIDRRRATWAVPLSEQSLESFRYSFDLQCVSIFDLIQQLRPKMDADTSIVVLGSIYQDNAPPGHLYKNLGYHSPMGYSATKGALAQMVRHLAWEIAPARINILKPGGLERGQEKRFQGRYKRLVPLGRMGTEQDLVEPCLFLAGEGSRYITGSTLSVDGGFSA